DCGNAAVVCIDLDRRPRIVLQSGVLGLDADEVRVAAGDSLPFAGASMIAATGGDDVVRAIAAQAELRERSIQIRPSVDQHIEARHVAASAAGCVMTQHAQSSSDVAAPAELPAVDDGNLQSRSL